MRERKPDLMLTGEKTHITSASRPRFRALRFIEALVGARGTVPIARGHFIQLGLEAVLRGKKRQVKSRRLSRQG